MKRFLSWASWLIFTDATRKKEAQLQKDLDTGNEIKVDAEGPVYHRVPSSVTNMNSKGTV